MKRKKNNKKTITLVLSLILFFPLGIYLLWKYEIISLRTVKIIAAVFIGLIIIGNLLPEPPSVSSSYDVQKAEITYTTEDIPGAEAVYEPSQTYTTELSGEYVIGVAPKDLTSGEEQEFETAQSGNYVAGEDFPIGIYDIVATSGNGNVMGSKLNQIMGVGTGLGSIDDMYVTTYDNHNFEQGETLKTSGVAVKLVPQTNDTLQILPGKYDIIAKAGNGNVTGTGLNEIMGLGTGLDTIDGMYVEKYENKDFKVGDTLNVSGVSVDLQPKEDKILIKEATEPIPGHEQTETLTTSPTGEFCAIDGKETNCDELTKYDELIDSLTVDKTVTEKVSYSNDQYQCYKDDLSKNCEDLYDYDNLIKQLDSEINK